MSWVIGQGHHGGNHPPPPQFGGLHPHPPPPAQHGGHHGGHLGGGGSSIHWVPASGGQLPPNAVIGGIEGTDALYVARGHHDNCLVPGKYHVRHRTCYVPYAGKEHTTPSYEILVAPPEAVSWVRAHNGSIPPDMPPVDAGHSKNREPYYIGRGLFNGTVTVGKVHPSHRCCYISYGGQEHKLNDYEVLVKNIYGVHMRA